MGPESNVSQGAVPAAQQSNTINPAEILSSIFTKNQGELANAAIKAATPIPGGHASSIPSTMLTPKGFSPGQLDHREVVGAGNARAQGIGNSVIAVMNAIAGTESALENKKKLEIASKTQQLITAQQAYDQAEQIYKQNPQNADAKAAMERNKNIMNGILADDKARKAIAKGMNVDFTDPKANDTVEHAGVAQGKQMAKEHVDYADQFNKQTPQVMQPNQQAIAQYQAKLQEQKLNVETMRAMIPLINAQMRQQDVEMQVKGRMDVAEFKEAGENARAYAKSQDDWNRLNTQIQARAQQMKTQFGYKMAEIGAEGTKEFEVFKAKMQAKGADPLQQVKAYTDFQNKSTARISDMTKTITQLEAQRQGAGKAASEAKGGYAKNDSAVRAIDEQIGIAKEQLKTYQDSVNATNDYYNAISKQKGGSQSGGSSSSSFESKSTRTLGSAATYASDEVVDPDEDSDNF